MLPSRRHWEQFDVDWARSEPSLFFRIFLLIENQSLLQSISTKYGVLSTWNYQGLFHQFPILSSLRSSNLICKLRGRLTPKDLDSLHTLNTYILTYKGKKGRGKKHGEEVLSLVISIIVHTNCFWLENWKIPHVFKSSPSFLLIQSR